jgi:hypothetical protein
VSTAFHDSTREKKNVQTTDNGTEDGAKKDRRSEHARGNAPIHGIPYIRNHTGAVGHWQRCNGKEPAEEAVTSKVVMSFARAWSMWKRM